MSFSGNTSSIADFCRELREARAYQQIELEDVERETRIAREFLEAIESARWDAIPRAYLRGYLSLYAQAVGMNREKVLRTFDQLMLPGGGKSGAAVLDEAPPLLKQPQDVAITRAKIRANWFAVLSRKRKVFYPLIFLAVLGLFALLHFTRSVQLDRTGIVPFSEALAESEQRLLAPLLEIPLPDSMLTQLPLKFQTKWAYWVGVDTGSMILTRDFDHPRRLLFKNYDTVKIQYLDTLSVKIAPSASAEAFHDSVKIEPMKSAKGDTAIYSTKAGRFIALDTTKSVPDSL